MSDRHHTYIPPSTCDEKVSRMARVSMKIPDATLQVFDALWKYEGWESRQEAIVFLLLHAVARGFISKEKNDVVRKMSLSQK